MKRPVLVGVLICAACIVTLGHVHRSHSDGGVATDKDPRNASTRNQLNQEERASSTSPSLKAVPEQRSSRISVAKAAEHPATIFVDLSHAPHLSTFSEWFISNQTESLMRKPLPDTLRAVTRGAEIAFIEASKHRCGLTQANVTVCVSGEEDTPGRNIVTALFKALTGHTVRCNESVPSSLLQLSATPDDDGKIEILDEERGQHLIFSSPTTTGLPQKLKATNSCAQTPSSAVHKEQEENSARCPPPQSILVVLGNKPLDAYTPSLDNVMRGVHAAKTYLSLFHRTPSPSSLNDVENSTTTTTTTTDSKPIMVVPTGGYVVKGLGLTEAAQLSYIMQYFGVPHGDIFTENSATTTVANAKLVKKLLVQKHGLSPKAVPNVVVVTKQTHMKSALSTVKRHFRQARAVRPPLIVSRHAMMADISAHLAWRQIYKPDPNPEKGGPNGYLGWRLDNLRNKRVRTD